MYTSSPLGVALDSNLMSSGFVSMSMSTNNRSLSVEEEDKVKVFQDVLVTRRISKAFRDF